jgi:hypothetical protein
MSCWRRSGQPLLLAPDDLVSFLEVGRWRGGMGRRGLAGGIDGRGLTSIGGGRRGSRLELVMLLEPLRGGPALFAAFIIELYDMPEAMRLLCVRDVIERLVPIAAALAPEP